MSDPRPSSGIEALVHSFYDRLWNAWDDAGVEAVLHPDLRFRGSLGSETVGRDGWRDYRDEVRSGSSDFHNQVVDLVCSGERAAARLEYSGTHTGALLGVPATQRRFGYAGAAFFTAGQGLLREIWVLGDLATLRAQLEA